MTEQDLRKIDNAETPDKFDYLKAKYVFRFPFTWTAIKWGIALGGFLGVHQFIKTKSFQTSLQWFIWGNVFTGMPIWAFFMAKYSFYTISIKRFENEQANLMDDLNLSRSYMIYKTKSHPSISDKALLDSYHKKMDDIKNKYNILDEALKNFDPEFFELKRNHI